MKRKGCILPLLVCLVLFMLIGCNRNVQSLQGYTYEGEKKDGLAHGNGALYKDGTLLYEGEFQEGYRLGHGSLFSDGVKSFEGEILDNSGERMVLSGTLFDQDGLPLYTGELTMEHGEVTPGDYGTLYYETGEVLYVGALSDGMPGDNGTYYNMDGEVLLDHAAIQELLR